MHSVYPFLLALLFCISCGPDGISPKEELPPATQEGKNTFGCLVNGEVWLPRGVLSNELTYYYYDNILNIAATRRIGSKDIRQSMFLRIKNITDTNKTDYVLSDFNPGGGGYSNLNTPCYYETRADQTGTLILSKLDTINHIIAGTFEFTVWTDECDTIKVTDGRFDIKYQQ